MPFVAPKTRPPAPIFNGSKDGTKITTWFEQFAAYAALLQLTPDTLVDHASLCLSGKAAEQWALIKKSLALHGKDVKDFDLFKAELLANFVDMSVEDTVRYRLAQLKQSGTVAQYYTAFRAITVEAVTYPVTGPEACAAFRAGLKPALLELIMKDASVRREMSNVEAVVKAAKEAESLLAMLSGVSKGKEKVYGDREEGEVPRDRGTKRPAHNHPKGATRHLGKLQKKYGLSQDRREAAGKLASGVCFDCNKPGHFAFECPLKKGSSGKKTSPGVGPSNA